MNYYGLCCTLRLTLMVEFELYELKGKGLTIECSVRSISDIPIKLKVMKFE